MHHAFATASIGLVVIIHFLIKCVIRGLTELENCVNHPQKACLQNDEEPNQEECGNI
jgi:hypothetical protein